MIKMMKNIGIETSSIMPLMETTPRTLPLQESMKEVIGKFNVEFYTDQYSIKEAIQQITTSFTNAVKSVEKAKVVADNLDVNDTKTLSIIFVKSLAENWYGREETLRWSDVIINDKVHQTENSEEFFKSLTQELNNKKEKPQAMQFHYLQSEVSLSLFCFCLSCIRGMQISVLNPPTRFKTISSGTSLTVRSFFL